MEYIGYVLMGVGVGLMLMGVIGFLVETSRKD